MTEMRVRITTDGACSGNPGPGGWGAIVEMGSRFFELAGGEPQTTNNRMEMTAVIEALRRVPPDSQPEVVTDSSYVRDGITKWIIGWKRRGWQRPDGSPVLNRDLWEQMDALASSRGARFTLVRGHAGHPLNERCDQLAVTCARGETPELRTGDVDSLPRNHSASAPPAGGSRKSSAPSSGSGGKPWYLSLVDGKLQRHATWPECQQTVNGAPRARFRKVTSPEQERAILAEWGCRTGLSD